MVIGLLTRFLVVILSLIKIRSLSLILLFFFFFSIYRIIMSYFPALAIFVVILSNIFYFRVCLMTVFGGRVDS